MITLVEAGALNPNGSVRWSHRVSAAYPSDAMALPDGSVLLTDYSSFGAVMRVAANGTVLWRYAPSGAGQLNHPSIAIPLASNRVAICDDFGFASSSSAQQRRASSGNGAETPPITSCVPTVAITDSPELNACHATRQCLSG